METVQVEIPAELMRRLQGSATNLVQIIEWGLDVAAAAEKPAVSPAGDAGVQERTAILDVLRSTGLVIDLETGLAARYQDSIGRPRRTPVYVAGKPLSEIIVAERGPDWPEKQ